MITRRNFVKTASGLFVAPSVMSRVLQEAAAPAMPGGVQVGDVTPTRAMLWSAADRPARMMVEISRDERFSSPRLIEGPSALENTGFTAKLDLGGLLPATFAPRPAPLAHSPSAGPATSSARAGALIQTSAACAFMKRWRGTTRTCSSTPAT